MVCAVRDTVFDVFCKRCGTHYIISLHGEDMNEWLSGSGFIQDIFDYLSANERELLLSGTCGECFDKIFPPLDIDE